MRNFFVINFNNKKIIRQVISRWFHYKYIAVLIYNIKKILKKTTNWTDIFMVCDIVTMFVRIEICTTC